MFSSDRFVCSIRRTLIAIVVASIASMAHAQVGQIGPPQARMHHGSDRGQVEYPPHP
jgi:hypothetical protein